ncbi:MAG: hypothetical protein RLZZ67_191 [Candidatus Parcubacteria bacterium]|jgi:hypothetical protein
MLIKQPQVRIVTKPVTLDNGEAALAYFALVTIEGQVEVRFLGTKAIETAETAPVLLLENICQQIFGETSSHAFSVKPSPFFSTLELLWNQLARAPSMN